MNTKKGLSDVVTTVIIIALSLVAIAVVWVVVQGLITSNTDSTKTQSACLNNDFVVESISTNPTTNAVNVVVKRTRGEDVFDGVRVNVYNATSSVASDIVGNLGTGSQKSASTITIISPTKVAIAAYTVLNNQSTYCNAVEKTI